MSPMWWHELTPRRRLLLALIVMAAVFAIVATVRSGETMYDIFVVPSDRHLGGGTGR
jgi:hypothetical protein